MLVIRYLAGVALLALALSLAACEVAPEPADDGGARRGGGRTTAFEVADVDRALRVAQARQRFGSVTQSSNFRADRVTTDRVEVGDGLHVRVLEAATGRERFSLDRGDAVDIESVPGGTKYALVKELPDGVAGAIVYAAGNSFAGGYWVRLANLAGDELQEIGIFVDGGERFSRSPSESWTRPAARQYSGSGEGIAHLRRGDEEDVEVLNLDICLDVTGSAVTGYLADDAGTVISLGPAPIMDNGTFESAADALRIEDLPGTTLASWGGAFADDLGGMILTFGLEYSAPGSTAGAALFMFYAVPGPC